jgi:hypothetical protein
LKRELKIEIEFESSFFQKNRFLFRPGRDQTKKKKKKKKEE